MSPEAIFLAVSAMVAGVVTLAALLALLPERRAARTPEPTGAASGAEEPAPLPPDPPYRSAVRVVWWVASAGVLIGVGVADIFGDTQTAIYALGGLSVVSVLVFHEFLPRRWQRPWLAGLECLAATGLGAALLLVTGYGSSAFAGVLAIPVVAVALAGGYAPAIGAALLATAAYLGVIAVDPRWGTYTSADVLGFAMTIGAVWLIAALASVFSESERSARREAAARSTIDPLTGLQNRSELAMSVQLEVRRSRRSGRGFCLLMVDLDGLKALNDTLGHARGDTGLQDLGGVIRSSIRAVDSAYRYGGDEFTVLLPETDFRGAFVVAEKIRTGAEEIGERTARLGVSTGVSIGLAAFPEDGSTADELMLAADRALYTAKAAGKNQISGYVRGPRSGPRPPAPAAPPGPTSVDAEPDPTVVRRQIENANQRFDSDHRIRQAMDAFLSPAPESAPPAERIA